MNRQIHHNNGEDVYVCHILDVNFKKIWALNNALSYLLFLVLEQCEHSQSQTPWTTYPYQLKDKNSTLMKQTPMKYIGLNVAFFYLTFPAVCGLDTKIT